jgi:hypothetical protein
MYFAYVDGRSNQDPSEKWYQGELNFYDFYLIPLAQKMKDCWRVFGISQSEFSQYASSNRLEWSMKGYEVVSNMKRRATETVNRRLLDGSSKTECIPIPIDSTQDKDNQSLQDSHDHRRAIVDQARDVSPSTSSTESNTTVDDTMTNSNHSVGEKATTVFNLD